MEADLTPLYDNLSECILEIEDLKRANYSCNESN